MKTQKNSINGYDLTRDWFDFAFENQGKVTGNHGCLYLWLVELNNRMGWAKTFASPASQTMAAVGISSYNTYKKVLDDLVDWGFVIMVKPSKNQYTANVIALSKNDKALYKALDKAMIKHYTKHDSSTIQSTDSINKQVNKETSKQVNNIDSVLVRKQKFAQSLTPFVEIFGKETVREFYEYWTEPNKSGTKFRQELQRTWDTKRRLETWDKNDFSKKEKFSAQKENKSKLETNLSVFSNALENIKAKRNATTEN